MKQIIAKLLYKITYNKIIFYFSGNIVAQKLLAKNVELSQYLMGIGSGKDTETSGEKEIIKRIRKKTVKKNRSLCIFDVGANKGQFIELIEEYLTGIPYRIHAFEPCHYTFKVLSKEIGTRPDILLNNYALGEKIGRQKIFYEKYGSGLASFSRRRVDHINVNMNMQEMVNVQTLDNYCKQNNIEIIDLLKLDVEGHELDILRGGRKILRSQKVNMISFEVGPCNIDSRTYLKDYFYFIKEIGGYRLYRVTPSGYYIKINNYREMYEQFQTSIFVAEREQMNTRTPANGFVMM